MAAELGANAQAWSFATVAPKLTKTRRLLLYGNDFGREHSEARIADVKAAGGTLLQSQFVSTDHSGSG